LFAAGGFFPIFVRALRAQRPRSDLHGKNGQQSQSCGKRRPSCALALGRIDWYGDSDLKCGAVPGDLGKCAGHSCLDTSSFRFVPVASLGAARVSLRLRANKRCPISDTTAMETVTPGA
jgi:hypothetical protein